MNVPWPPRGANGYCLRVSGLDGDDSFKDINLTHLALVFKAIRKFVEMGLSD